MVAMALHEARETAKKPCLELLIVGTTSGGMSYGELYYRRLLATQSRKGLAPLVGNYMPQKPVLAAPTLPRPDWNASLRDFGMFVFSGRLRSTLSCPTAVPSVNRVQ